MFVLFCGSCRCVRGAVSQSRRRLIQFIIIHGQRCLVLGRTAAAKTPAGVTSTAVETAKAVFSFNLRRHDNCFFLKAYVLSPFADINAMVQAMIAAIILSEQLSTAIFLNVSPPTSCLGPDRAWCCHGGNYHFWCMLYVLSLVAYVCCCLCLCGWGIEY